MVHGSVDKLYGSLNMLTGYDIHLENTALGPSVRMFLESFDGGGMTHPESRQHYPIESQSC